MSNSRILTSSQERPEVSPAREALQAVADNAVKKPGLFDTLRIFGQRSALSVKASLDTIRGEPQRLEPGNKLSPRSKQASVNASYLSTAEDGSRMPKRSSTRRSQTISPKSAMTTWHLRNRLDRQNRGSVSTMSYISREGVKGAEGPERFSMDPTDSGLESQTSAGHSRRVSVATIVGSLRGLRRIVSLRLSASPAPYQIEHETSAQMTQGRSKQSSPIDIPISAPALTLDLDHSGLMSDTLSCSPDALRRDSHLTDPKNITTGVPLPSSLHIPESFKAGIAAHNLEGIAPKTSDLPWGLPSQQHPPTPMPGTNLPLELDGASEINPFARDACPLPPIVLDDDNVRQRLRSYSAIAEKASSLIQKVGEHKGPPQLINIGATDMTMHDDDVGPSEPRRSPTTTGKPEQQFMALKLTSPDGSASLTRSSSYTMDAVSFATASSCPSDMTRLYRFGGTTGATPEADEAMVEDGVGLDNGIATCGPPSPTRTVRLPLRPKESLPTEKSMGPKSTEEGFDQHWPSLRAQTLMAAHAISLGQCVSTTYRPPNWRLHQMASSSDSVRGNMTSAQGGDGLVLESRPELPTAEASAGSLCPASDPNITDNAFKLKTLEGKNERLSLGSALAADSESARAHDSGALEVLSPSKSDQAELLFPEYNASSGALVKGCPSESTNQSPKSSKGKGRLVEDTIALAFGHENLEAVESARSSRNDYDEFKTQQLFGSGKVLDEDEPDDYDSVHSSTFDICDGSPRGGPLVQHFDDDSVMEMLLGPSGTPKRKSGKASMTMNGLPNNSDDMCGLDDSEDARSSNDHFPDVSIDESVIATFMGSPTEFALRQSERNMRYNSLHEHIITEPRTPFIHPQDSPVKSESSQSVAFTPTLPCKPASANRFSALALDCSSPEMSERAKAKTSPAQYRKHRSFLSAPSAVI